MPPAHEQETVIKVVGVGGGGGNAVNRMVLSGMKGVEFIAMNTDYQVLATSHATYKLNIGSRLTKGQGAGGDASVGQRAAEESRDEIASMLKGTDMVFITAGMGGGTGTGAAPVVAEIAHDMGILTVAVVTKPFLFERKPRMDRAEMGIAALREHVDAILVIPNERLRQASVEPITLRNAFAMADEVLRQGVQSISDLISTTGVINLDFADVCSIMRNAGYAHMGVGRGSGKDKARMAAESAINSPLLETTINGARGVIVNVTVPPDIPLEDVYTASDLIADAAYPDVNLIWGVAYDENLKDEMIVTVIATGFDHDPKFNSVPDYTFKDNGQTVSELTRNQPETPAPESEEVKEEEPKQEEPQEEEKNDEFDETFAAVMRIFNKR
ncbi:MAG: cell division protein FtsZ [Oscillospiraceae bacterium]|nr:cell division protein FtsZ [Oscillospiraceae bacterium]